MNEFAFSVFSERLNAKKSTLKSSIPDWNMVKDVENGLVANSPLQFKLPDIDSEEVYAIKYSNIGHILEKIEELQLVSYKLPLSLRFSDEFEATFRNVSSIRGGGTIYSDSVMFGPPVLCVFY